MDVEKGVDVGFDLYDLTDRMRTRGWQVASYSLPANCEDMVIQRVLIRHGFSHDMAELFIGDLKRSIEYLQKRRIVKINADDKEQQNSFHH